MASNSFDNGLPAGLTSWISAGTLNALHSSRHSAAQAGLPATPAVDNLIMSAESGAIDRIVSALAGRESIRDVIAFPKAASGADPLTGAPAPVDPAQLRELGLRSL